MAVADSQPQNEAELIAQARTQAARLVEQLCADRASLAGWSGDRIAAADLAAGEEAVARAMMSAERLLAALNAVPATAASEGR
jgi:hypothetical protein